MIPANSVLIRLPVFASLGEPDPALDLLRSIARLAESPVQGEALLRAASDALHRSPDPRRALIGFERWSRQLISCASTYALLLENPRLLHDLLLLFAASPFLTDILAREPELYNLLAAPPEDGQAPDYAGQVAAAFRSLRRPDSRRTALRRIRRREVLRLAWQDLTSRVRFGEVTARITDLADALVAGALSLALDELAPQFPSLAGAIEFTIIGMGKLGGEELNYSSDVDLLFVFDSADPRDARRLLYARRLAERVIHILAEETPEGRLFRVDMRLRPEGRYGELVRSLGGFREYYDRWVETWERQSLIKARRVAGSAALGEAFLGLARSTAYRRAQDPDLPREVRDVKALMQQRASGPGQEMLNVKEGRGTIREVEFAVQLLQLLFGGQDSRLQERGTLAAMAALEESELVDRRERRRLRGGYRFFRVVEHRLQLEDDLPVRNLPADPNAQRRLARLLGYPNAGLFLAACARRAAAVMAVCDGIYARLGAGEGGESDALQATILSLHAPEARGSLGRQLAQHGLVDGHAALAAVERLGLATPHAPHPMPTRRVFSELAPALFRAVSNAADPDLALVSFQRLADRSVLHRSFYQRFLDQPADLEDLCRLLGASPTLGRLLERFPEYLEVALDRPLVADSLTQPELEADLDQRLVGLVNLRGRMAQLRRFRIRHLVRLAARELLTDGDPMSITDEWSMVAEVALRAALSVALTRLRAEQHWSLPDSGSFAIVGLGRLGGRELHFGSDLDLVYLFADGEPREYEGLARALNEVVGADTPEGRLFELDLRLRPEGRSGFLVGSVDAYRRYFHERAWTWERQAFLKARHVAGAAAVTEELLGWLAPQLYGEAEGDGWREEISRMRGRMQSERVRHEERDRHLKLGPGGLADVEFLTQLLQHRHGAADPAVHRPGTLPAVAALADAGALARADCGLLTHGYRFLTRLRQRLWLCLGEDRADILPVDPRELRRLGRSMTDGDSLPASYREVTESIRSIYGRVMGA